MAAIDTLNTNIIALRVAIEAAIVALGKPIGVPEADVQAAAALVAIETAKLVAATPASAPPVITVQPSGGNSAVGADVILTVVASGSAPLSYAWQVNGSPLTDSTSVSGSATPTLTLIAAQPSASGTYTVIVSNAAGKVTSAATVVTVA